MFYVNYANQYNGFHSIVSVDTNGNILTSTDYNGDASGLDGNVLVNLKYRIFYGYPTLDNFRDISPIWTIDKLLVTNIAPIMESVFTIQPPVAGFDESLYTHFKIKIIAADDFAQFLVDNALNEETVINVMSEYDFSDDANKRWLINGSLTPDEIEDGFLDPIDTLDEVDPILFVDQCVVFSKLIETEDGGRVFNVMYCNGTAAETGIGFMAIEDDFIVS